MIIFLQNMIFYNRNMRNTTVHLTERIDNDKDLHFVTFISSAIDKLFKKKKKFVINEPCVYI